MSELDKFEAEFRDLLEGAERMFRLPDAHDDRQDDDPTDLDRIQQAELHVMHDIDRAKRQVDAAREELKRECTLLVGAC